MTQFNSPLITTACLLPPHLTAVPLTQRPHRSARHPLNTNRGQPCRTEQDTPLLVRDERPGKHRCHCARHLDRPLLAWPATLLPPRPRWPQTTAHGRRSHATMLAAWRPVPAAGTRNGPSAPAVRLRLGSQRPPPPWPPPLTRCPAPVAWRPACWPAAAG